MPRSVKFFLGLCLVYSVWLVWVNLGYLLFPSPHRLQMLASLPASVRVSVDEADWSAAVMRPSIHLAFALTFALIAALGRKNWARWALAIFLIATEFTFFAVVAVFSLRQGINLIPEFTWSGAWQNWLHSWGYWQNWTRLVLKLLMIGTIFGPGTKAWFHRVREARPSGPSLL